MKTDKSNHGLKILPIFKLQNKKQNRSRVAANIYMRAYSELKTLLVVHQTEDLDQREEVVTKHRAVIFSNVCQ